ncbi:MAG: type II secretion system protein [Alphaproteobacteria bacterium]|nr:type II secretion system protein [Alphaproteobacteria bacterium]
MKKYQAGYSLIQMAIALMVIGILSVAALQVYAVYTQHEKIIKTQQAIETAVKKIQTFRQTYGHYPCPAPSDASRTDADYGRSTDCLDTSLAIGSCANGICIGATNRLIDDDGDPVTPDVATDIRVRVGTVPFRELQMDEKETFDSFDSRLTYAITERMGNSSTFKETQGGINIQDELGQDLVEPPGSAAFIVLSHGPNRIGAYDALSGNQHACAGAGLDVQNCIDTAAPPTAAAFVNTLYSDGTPASGFDDTVQYFATASNPLWRRVTASSENIVDMADENVGIGVNTPSEALTVAQSTVNPTTGLMMTTNSTASGAESGAIRTPQIQADTYCDESGTNCFQTKDIMGDPDLGTGGMKCPAGTYMVALKSDGTNAVPDCQPVRSVCTGGQVIIGLNSDGSPICTPVAASCPAENKSVCGTVHTLPVTGSGLVRAGYTGGDCRTESFKCNNGIWSLHTTSGSCTATVTTGLSCDPGYTGTYTSNSCTGSTAATDCLCVGNTYNDTVLCTSPFTGGSQVQTCTRICVANVLQPPTCGPLTGVCGCSKTDDWTFAQCPAGFKRNASYSPSSFTSPTKSWPMDESYGKYRKLTANTTTCTYDNPPYDDSNCVCDNKPKYTNVWKSPSHYPVLYPGPAACYQAKAGTRNVYDGSTLASSNLSYQYAVTKTPKDVSCNYDAAATTTLEEATFVTKPYYWRRQAGARLNATVQSSTGSKPEADTSCNCLSQIGTVSQCAVAVVGGYDIYTCKCAP